MVPDYSKCVEVHNISHFSNEFCLLIIIFCVVCLVIITDSLESVNSSILAAHSLYREVVGEHQDFMLIRMLNA